MKNTYIVAVAILVLALSGTAVAEDSQFTKQYSNCMDKSGGVTPDMIDCIEAETKIQDARLNTAYKKLTKTLGTARKKELLTVQRLWIQFRDANCGFYYDPDGGQMAHINANDCVLQATASRAKEIENFLVE